MEQLESLPHSWTQDLNWADPWMASFSGKNKTSKGSVYSKIEILFGAYSNKEGSLGCAKVVKVIPDEESPGTWKRCHGGS